jgi:hypothetical protein
LNSEGLEPEFDRVRRQGAGHSVILYVAVDSVQELLEWLQWFGEKVMSRVQ